MTIEARVLGPLEVVGDSGPLDIGGPRQRRLLAPLLLQLGDVVPTDRLIDTVWNGDPPAGAPGTFRTYVARLRRSLGGNGLVRNQPPGYVLDATEISLDAAEFERLIGEARARLGSDPAGAVETLCEAIALWRGPAYDEFADEQWCQPEAARLEELRSSAGEDLAEARLACGFVSDTIPDLEALIAEHPLRERPRRLLMLALYRAGRQPEALRTYQAFRAFLGEELGLEPSEELQRLEGQIASRDPALMLRSPAGRPLRGYRIGDLLGEGRSGAVYRATQPSTDREVAVRVIAPDLANAPHFIRRFELDAQAISHLEHPHVVPIYDYWREPDGAYLVMRLLGGGSVADSVGGPPWPVERVARLVEQVGGALAVAHRAGLAHGAVRPGSILLDAEGNAYLSDFVIGADTGPRSDDTAGLAETAERLLGDAPPAAAVAVLAEADELEAIDFTRRFVAACTQVAPYVTLMPPSGVAPANPYKGLRAFTEADAGDYFGRDDLVDDILARLDDGARLVAVVGPSGCGKSSLVRAGVVPRVRAGGARGSDEWFVVTMLPGTNPFDELEAALLRVAVNPPATLVDQLTSDERGIARAVERVLPDDDSELLLVVDQFEELFTLAPDDVRQGFVARLVAAVTDPRSRLRVITTIRADFYDRPLLSLGLGSLVSEASVPVAGLAPHDLEQAVVGPAGRVGVGVEPALVADIVAAIADQPAALPLLQYSLTELFDSRSGEGLTLADYERLGGVSGALSRRAEQVYESLTVQQRSLARDLFARLITFGDGNEDTRRRTRMRELTTLASEPAAMAGVIDRFGAARLLVFDHDPDTRDPTVEVAHEALIRHWPRLRDWVDEDRDGLRILRHLTDAAGAWERLGREPGELYRGVRLRLAIEWVDRSEAQLTVLEREFLDASVHQEDTEEATHRAQVEREGKLERRSVRRLRVAVAILAVAAIVAGGLTVFAFDQREDAQSQSAVATARSLAAASVASLDEDPGQALLLALDAADATDDPLPEAIDALHRSLAAERQSAVIPWPEPLLMAPGLSVSASPDGRTVAVSGDGGVIQLWDVTTSSISATLGAGGGQAAATAPLRVEFSPDGAHVAGIDQSGVLRVWDVASGAELFSNPAAPKGPGRVQFSADGRRIVTTGANPNALADLLPLVVWDAATGELVATPGAEPWYSIAALSPTGDVVAAAGVAQDFPTQSLELLSVPDLERLALIPNPSGVTAVDLLLTADELIVAGTDGAIRFYDPRDGEEQRRIDAHRGEATALTLSDDGTMLASAGIDGVVRIWDMQTGAELLRLAGHAGGVDDLAFAPGGGLVYSAGRDRTVRAWDVRPTGAGEVMALQAAGLVTDLAYDGQGDVLVGASPGGAVGPTPLGGRPVGGTVEVWDSVTGDLQVAIDDVAGTVAAVTDDGAQVLLTGELGREGLFVHDTKSGEELGEIGTYRNTRFGLALSADGNTVAQVQLNGGVAVWDTGANEQLLLRRYAGCCPSAVAISADGSLVAAVGEAGVVQLWDVGTGDLVTEADHGAPLDGVAIDPDGSLVATVGGDATLRLWAAEDGRPVLTVRLPVAASSVEFSPDGLSVAVGSGDGVARVFDVAAGEEVVALPPLGSQVGDVAFHPNGRHIAVAGDGLVRVHTLDPGELIDLARQRVSR